MMFTLAIHSTSPEESWVLIASGATRCVKRVLACNGKRGDILAAIDALVRSKKKSIKSMAGIIVVTGPGHFSHIRMGISVANALGFALGIPVVGFSSEEYGDTEELIEKGKKKLSRLKKFTPVVPAYGREPTITLPHSKS